MSSNAKVDGLHIEKMPASKPVKVARAVSCGRVVLMQAENGRLYSNSADPYCYVPGSFDRHNDWFRALRALGVLTKEQVAEHKKCCDDRDEARSKRYAADAMVRAAKDSGIGLSASQAKFVKQHASRQATP